MTRHQRSISRNVSGPKSPAKHWETTAPATRRKILIVSPNVSMTMGGEALKVFQYVTQLRSGGTDVQIVTHSRCRAELLAEFPRGILSFVEDDAAQRFFWKSRVLGFLVTPYFHMRVRKIVRDTAPQRSSTVIHYVCPISPMEPRFCLPGYPTIIGPLNGNIGYPPALRHRAGLGARLHAAVYSSVNFLLGPVLKKERGSASVLVSGGKRTLDVLGGGGANVRRVLEVRDAGVANDMVLREPVIHAGFNGDFYTCSRLVGWKGVDLAIRALGFCEDRINLHVIGSGPALGALRTLARELRLEHRVHFRGWIRHQDMASELRTFRGFIFPTMCEANGIVMQEAMMSGLPVVTLRWGGPAMLADDGSAILIDPTSEAIIVSALGQAMTQLAIDPDYANGIAKSAREKAEREFTWETVAKTWSSPYEALVD